MLFLFALGKFELCALDTTKCCCCFSVTPEILQYTLTEVDYLFVVCSNRSTVAAIFKNITDLYTVHTVSLIFILS